MYNSVHIQSINFILIKFMGGGSGHLMYHQFHFILPWIHDLDICNYDLEMFILEHEWE